MGTGFSKVIGTLLLIGGVAAVAWFAYHAGQVSALPGGAMAAEGRHYGPWFGGFLFFPFFFLVPLFFLGMLKMLFFGFGHRRWMDGPGGQRMQGHLDEWYRQAHEAQPTEAGGTPPQPRQ